jgi:spore germination protein KB
VFLTAISLYTVLALSTQDSSIHAVFPIWGPGKIKILKHSFLHMTLFADFFLFTMLIPFITSMKDFRKGTWFAYVYVTIQIGAAMLIYICMFDASLAGIGYPFHTAIRYLSIGSYLPNVEIIFFVLWLMGAFIRFTAFLYINALMFGRLFKIKNFEYLIPSLAAIYLMIGSIPEAPVNVVLPFKTFIKNTGGPTLAAISLLLWLVALLKGEFKHEKNRNSM